MKGTTQGSEEMVQQHIIRSTSKKDRHSKVHTSKGPRDRRVRLAAHTAIQFYDVQDRLGYDRPSKAVDWLIDKARTAIDNLSPLQPADSNPSPLNPHPAGCSTLFPAANFGGTFHGQDLGLSLQSLQEGGFQGWNSGAGRVGFGLPDQTMPAFSHRELLQSNFGVNPLQLQPNYNNTDDSHKSLDLQNPFELGFRFPTRIYGEEDHPMNH